MALTKWALGDENYKTLQELEAEYEAKYPGLDTSGGVFSDARHAAATNLMSDKLGGIPIVSDTLANVGGAAREIPTLVSEMLGLTPTGQSWEDIQANALAYSYPKGTSAADIYADVFAKYDEAQKAALADTNYGYGTAQAGHENWVPKEGGPDPWMATPYLMSKASSLGHSAMHSTPKYDTSDSYLYSTSSGEDVPLPPQLQAPETNWYDGIISALNPSKADVLARIQKNNPPIERGYYTSRQPSGPWDTGEWGPGPKSDLLDPSGDAFDFEFKEDAPYGIGPDGKPYKTPRTIQDQNRVLGMTFTEPKQNLLEQIMENNLALNLFKGVGSFAGDFFRSLAPYEYGTSSRYHQNLSPQGKAFANKLYAPGGSLQGYNQISAWGGGPSASLGKRADRIDKTLAKWEANPTKYADKLANTTLYDRRDRLRNEQNILNTTGWNQGAKAKTQGTIQQLNPHEMRNVATTGDAGGNTGKKIVCTMMNERYGFGSFRNKIWMKFHESYGPEYQKGYHTIFLPLVKIAKGEGKLNTAVRKVLEHMGRHVTADMFKIMKGKKRDTLGRIYRAIFEPTCRIIGKIKSALGRG